MTFNPVLSLRLTAAATALGVAFLAGGCSAPEGKRSIDGTPPTMALYNAPPKILQSDDDKKAAGVNAIVGWHAELRTAEGASGKTLGYCNGTMLITRSSAVDDEDEHRMTMIEFDWDDSNDSLVVGGAHPYLSTQTESRTPIVRAIFGGTGRFVGSMGQVVSTPLPSGWYRHDIWLVD